MEVKIKITTPKGMAKGFNNEKMDFWNFDKKFIKKLLLSTAKVKEEYVNEDASQIFWVVEVSAKDFASLGKRVAMYDGLVRGVFQSKLVQSALKRMADKPEDVKEIERMLKRGTKIEIIKEATLREMDDYGKSFWQRMKDKFKKTKMEDETNGEQA